MRKIALILAVVAIASLMASVSYAAGSITVNDTCTICPTYCPTDVYGAWQPLGWYVNCTINGSSTYRLIVRVKALGETHSYVYKNKTDGFTAEFRDFMLINGATALGDYPVKFIFVLKEGATRVDRQVVTRTISVVGDYNFSQDCPYKSECLGECGN